MNVYCRGPVVYIGRDEVGTIGAAGQKLNIHYARKAEVVSVYRCPTGVAGTRGACKDCTIGLLCDAYSYELVYTVE